MSLSPADVQASKGAPTSATSATSAPASASAKTVRPVLLMRDPFGRVIGVWQGQILVNPR